jgi:hypothetical protein
LTPFRALLLTLLATLACLLPVIGRGHVFFAHGNEMEVGLAPQHSAALANRRLSDQSAAFAPELALHLSGEHSSWTALWNPHVQLGRPAYHTGGMSKAFWPTHLLAWLHDDVLVVMSMLVCLTLLLSAAFAFGMAHELGARPLIAAACGVGFALAPFSAYWSSFPLFLSGQCWTMGLLFCSARFLRTGNAWSAFGVVLCAHTLLAGAYPQAVIWSLYLAVPLMIAWSVRYGWKRGLVLSGLGLLGAASSWPLLMDLALAASRSARLEADSEFFTSVLPRLTSAADWTAAAAAWVESGLAGNPLRDPRAASFLWSAALTPLFAGLAVLAVHRRARAETWISLGYVGVLFLATFVPAFYLFGWEHLGWSLSRFVPLGALLVPSFLLAALGAERLMSGPVTQSAAVRERTRIWSLIWPLALPIACVLIDASVRGVQAAAGLASALGFALLLLSAWRRDPRLVFAGACAGALWYGGLNFLHRAPDEVQRASPLVELVRQTAGDARLAWVTSEPARILPPNQECWLGLSSVHSYDSLSSLAYQQWCETVSSEAARNYGRKFDHIEGLEGLRSEAFRQARVGAVLSDQDLRVLGWRRVAEFGRFALWSVPERVPMARIDGAAQQPVRLEQSSPERITLTRESSDQEARVVLSQQFHPQWTAHAGEQRLETQAHQGLWQAVMLPAGVSAVTLEFRPWVRWMWTSQLGLGVLALLILLRSLRSSRAQPERPVSGFFRQPGAPSVVEG